MKCTTCVFKREIDLPYRREFSPGIICCHPNIAMQSNWIFAGKIIDRNGSDPSWCVLLIRK